MSQFAQFATATVLRVHAALRSLRDGAQDERGEGVISAAIVVLIMALIGAAMWVAFNGVFEDASGRVTESVGQIGG